MREVIRLSEISEDNLPAALSLVHNYLKVSSMVWIRALGQPTLDGIVAKRWSQGVSRALRRFCDKDQWSEVLLRIDKHGKRWSSRRGGYLIKTQDARIVLDELNREDMIAVFLEPWSPYRDLYCLSSVFIPEEGRLLVEVVGPGFDTSDLVRSDLAAHERFDLKLHGPRFEPASRRVGLPRRTHLITLGQYKAAVQERLSKVGARLKNAAFPMDAIDDSLGKRAELRLDAMRYLRRTRQTLLLRHADRYVPIPEKYLARFIAGVLWILAGLERYDLQLGTTTFSGAFTTRGRLVFWDFFPADAKKADALYTPGNTARSG